MNDCLEEGFWEFDAMRKGYGQYKGCPQDERDAYKMSIRSIIKKKEIEKSVEVIKSVESLCHVEGTIKVSVFLR